ncbi:MAG TPA: hypothetical protein VEC11_04130 [Allosphingosinicella sp.]|nr:hypothetical protein [Allosphingosinicella sp.]
MPKRRVLLALAWLCSMQPAFAQPLQGAAVSPPRAMAARDGQRDFDFEIGRWRTELRYLQNPLSGEPERWVDYRGTSIVTPAMDGDANLVELDVAGAAGRIRGLSLRLYNPHTRQWSLNFASKRSGRLTAPVHGSFDAGGRGLFYGRDDVDGRVVLVRFVITPEGRDRIRFVQSFSADAGATWQDNWIAVDTRLPARP